MADGVRLSAWLVVFALRIEAACVRLREHPKRAHSLMCQQCLTRRDRRGVAHDVRLQVARLLRSRFETSYVHDVTAKMERGAAPQFEDR